MLVDLSRCIGCFSCVIACKQENSLPPGTNWVNIYSRELFSPYWQRYSFPNSCRHCHQPACAAICPVGALEMTPEQVVIYHGHRCIGCYLCHSVCPYNAISENIKPSKCTLCYHLQQRGAIPACAQVCPTKARVFSSREEILKEAEERVFKLQSAQKAVQLVGNTGPTKSSVLFLAPNVPVW